MNEGIQPEPQPEEKPQEEPVKEVQKPLTEGEYQQWVAQEKVLRYLRAKHDLKQIRSLSNLLKVTQSFPDLNKVLGGLVIMIVGLVGLRYLPFVSDYVSEYMGGWMTGKALFTLIMGYGLFTTMMLVFIGMFCRKVTGPWIRAGLFGSKIVPLIDKSNDLKFITPSKTYNDIWDLGDDAAIQPADTERVIGPHRVSMMFAVPEYPVGFNPRNLFRNVLPAIDIMSLKQYAILHEQKMFEKMRTSKEWMKQMVLPVVILLAVLLTLSPFFYQKMQEYDASRVWQGEYEECRVEMLNAGVVPADLQKSKEPEDKSKVKPASTGLTVSGS